jgi:DNA-binding transcriptional LysR family regulator
MPRPLPPLNALRAFEAAARHMSLTKAATELHVTQAAVSHQVKSLERHIGVALFRRLPRALLLTEAGQKLLPELREAFARIVRAVERLETTGRGGTLSISLLITFALTWLVPRLPRFQALHPEIEVRITTNQKLIDFTAEDVDLAVRYGRGPWPGLRQDKIFDETLTPLCGPALAARLRKPEDLLQVPLLITDYDKEWPIWLKAAALDESRIKRGAFFDSTRIAVQAAIAGAGVAIGPPFLFAEDLAAGTLVQPFALEASSGMSWWLVYPDEAADRPKIQVFRAWILAEAASPLTAVRPVAPTPTASPWVHHAQSAATPPAAAAPAASARTGARPRAAQPRR